MNDARWWLVCYDVHDPARLRRCAVVLEGAGQRMPDYCVWHPRNSPSAVVLEGAGQRMQHSIFRCWMTPARMHQLRWELTQVLEPEDDVLLIPLCPRCVAGMETTHSARKVPDWPSTPEPHRIV